MDLKYKILLFALVPFFAMLFSVRVYADSYYPFDYASYKYTIYDYNDYSNPVVYVPETAWSFGQYIRFDPGEELAKIRFVAGVQISGSSLSGGRLAVPYVLSVSGDYLYYRLNFYVYDEDGQQTLLVSYYVHDVNNVIYFDLPDNVHLLYLEFDFDFDSVSFIEFVLSVPYFVSDSASDEFTTVLEEVQKQTELQSDIKAEISQQTDLQQSVVDSADTAFEGVNDSVGNSVSEYQAEESRLTDIVDSTIGAFNFSDYLIGNIGGFAPAMSFLSAQLTALFGLTDFSAIFYVVVAISVTAILLGIASLWRR